jgi:hypothetical protein
MSEMVERAARAMVDSDGDNTVMDHHRRRVRAVIEAMREPTTEMLVAGYNASTCGYFEEAKMLEQL